MRDKQYSKKLGATAGYTARLARGSKYYGNNSERQTAEEEGKKRYFMKGLGLEVW